MLTLPSGEPLLPTLESEERFRPLAAFFSNKGIEELFPTSGDRKDNAYITAGFNLVLEKCHNVIRALSESPIEQVFLRSLMLSFLRNSQCLVFMPAFRNTLVDLTAWQSQLQDLDKFTQWYEQRHGPGPIADGFLDAQVSGGRLTPEEMLHMKELLILYHSLPFRHAWHVGLQARFPALLSPRGTIRVDMLFWLPAHRSIRLVVECDGFAGHQFKSSFQRDRQKDRALKAKGFDVFRFTGAEINADPIGSTTELFNFLSKREHSSRKV